MPLDDLHLDRPETHGAPLPSPSQSGGSPMRWIAVGLAGVVAGGLLTFWWMSRSQPGTAPLAPTTATEVAVGSKRPKRQPITLPALESSDTFLRDLIAALSAHPTLARLLATPELVRGATLAVVQMGDGRTPAVPMKVLRPATRLQILGTTSGTIDPKSYTRWDAASTALASVNPDDAAQLYVNVKPLFDQAYVELGHAGGDFDDALARAIRTLAEVPTLAEEPQVERRTNYLEYEDEALRGLEPVQKQFLLLGPDNRRRVLAWLRQFAARLELTIP